MLLMNWPSYTAASIRDLVFSLTYSQHGGSGLNWTKADVMDLDLTEANAYVELLGEQRRKEAAAMKAAQSRKVKAK